MAMSPTDEVALVVEDRREGGAVVGGLVDAAGGRRHVERRRVALEHGQVVDASRRRAGPDLPEGQPVERVRPGDDAVIAGVTAGGACAGERGDERDEREQRD